MYSPSCHAPGSRSSLRIYTYPRFSQPPAYHPARHSCTRVLVACRPANMVVQCAYIHMLLLFLFDDRLHYEILNAFAFLRYRYFVAGFSLGLWVYLHLDPRTLEWSRVYRFALTCSLPGYRPCNLACPHFASLSWVPRSLPSPLPA